jgi:hypothetical protein
LYLVQAVGVSIIATWLYNGTGGSLLLVILLHAAIDAFPQPLRILPAATGSLRPFVLSTVLVWLWALWVALATRPLADHRSIPQTAV